MAAKHVTILRQSSSVQHMCVCSQRNFHAGVLTRLHRRKSSYRLIVAVAVFHCLHQLRSHFALMHVAGQGLMTAAEIFINLHSIDAAKDKIPLKRVMACLDPCMRDDMRSTFPPESMAVALQQLVTRSAVAPCTVSWMSLHWSINPYIHQVFEFLLLTCQQLKRAVCGMSARVSPSTTRLFLSGQL